MSTDLSQRLEHVRARRGYLLPHHGLMATALPGMLEAYDTLYTALALTPRALSRQDHEYVWLALLIGVEESLGTHHIRRFRDAGGTDARLRHALAVAACARGVDAHQFVDTHWSAHLPGLSGRQVYLDGFRRVAGDDELAVAHLAAMTVHVGRANWEGLGWQISAAYDTGVDEDAMAEALSMTMFPGSVPNFAKACRAWQQLIADGEVAASPRYRQWATLAGQGGYDEASGVGAAGDE